MSDRAVSILLHKFRRGARPCAVKFTFRILVWRWMITVRKSNRIKSTSIGTIYSPNSRTTEIRLISDEVVRNVGWLLLLGTRFFRESRRPRKMSHESPKSECILQTRPRFHDNFNQVRFTHRRHRNHSDFLRESGPGVNKR